jgi:flagellar biosynthesis protein FlhG
MNNDSVFIPIASGKGGVGKSLITANLAISIANLGHTVVAVDLDLGGANLYSYLGLENNYSGIGDYLNSKKGKLADYLAETDFPNLLFLAGERRMTFTANIPFAQKVKLINEIKKIEADYILLDLGAGTTFNTLDYFDFSKNGIVISTFEKPSVLNSLSFIKNFLHRILLKEAKQNHRAFSDINKAYKNAVGEEFLMISELIDMIRKIDPALALRISDLISSYNPRIIFNRGVHPDELNIINPLQLSVKKNISVDLCFFGFLFEDEHVKLSLENSVSLVCKYPESIASKGINEIAKRIVKFSNKVIPNSGELLKRDTLEKYELWNADLII